MLHNPRIPRKVIALPLPINVPPPVREHIEKTIELHQRALEGLITLLDMFDGDTELEEGHDRELDEADDEPSLAHKNDLNQTKAGRLWSDLNGVHHRHDQDLEAEHDGREPDEDLEPEPTELDNADDEPRCPPMMD